MEIPQYLIMNWMKHFFQVKIKYFFTSNFVKFWKNNKFQLSTASIVWPKEFTGFNKNLQVF